MFDIVIIGGGPAGVTAALRASELGAKVALVERGRMGGTCTNDGCVPTRVLAKAARLRRDSRQFADYGLIGDMPEVDFAKVIERTQQIVYQVHEKKQLLAHLQDVNVTTYVGVGDTHFVDPHTLAFADGGSIQGERFVLCVGGSPRRLNFPGSEHTITHSDVWTLKKRPEAVIVIGAGATGCQLASIFNDFGSEVMLLDAAPRILMGEDELVSQTVTEAFRADGITVMTGIGMTERVEKDGNTLILHYNGQETPLRANAIVMSVGWPGNIDGLHLNAAGVETERNYIRVNDYLQTSAPHIFAAGDITGRMMLVQSAGYQARVAAENALLGLELVAQHRLVPHGGFTDPEYGGVGMTETQARQHYDCVVATVPYAEMDRAIIDGHTQGFCKLIVERDSQHILGAHVVGEQALEVVQLVAGAMAGGSTVMQLADMELAYPTFAAVVGLAARQIVRELGAVKVAPQWRALAGKRVAEWERQTIVND